MRHRPIVAGELRLGRLALRRRSLVEQRTIRMIRGDETDAQDRPPVHAAQFGRLRALAAKNDLVIQSPGAPFISMDELRLLAWLAQAQRVLGYARPFHPDATLTLTVVHCAGTLDALGVHLPPLTIYSGGFVSESHDDRRKEWPGDY